MWQGNENSKKICYLCFMTGTAAAGLSNSNQTEVPILNSHCEK